LLIGFRGMALSKSHDHDLMVHLSPWQSNKAFVNTKTAAIGSIYALSSRVIALAGGFIIHIFLARWWGPQGYGVYALIMSILLWVELSVLAGILSTYRKVVSEDQGMLASARYSLKTLFLPYCLLIMGVYFIASPIISHVLDDNRLLPLLLIAGIDIPLVALYHAHLSIMNGSREFLRENLSISVYALSKVLLIILFAFYSFGLEGALIGNFLASLSGLVVAFSFVRRLQSPERKTQIRCLKPRIVSFGLPYLLYILTTMLLVHIDMWFVKFLLKDDAMTGFYAVSYSLSRPLSFLLGGVTTVIFPSLSRSLSQDNIALSQKYIKQAVRVFVLTLLPLAVMICSTSDRLITLLFTSSYLPATNALKILAFGHSFFAIFLLLLNFIAAGNKPAHSFSISVTLVPLAIILNYFLINLYGIHGAALATTTISAIGVLGSGIYVWRRFGVLINFATLLRAFVAAGSLYFISSYIAAAGYYLIFEYLLLSLIYLLLLLGLREVDFQTVRETCYSLLKPSQIAVE